MHLPGRCFLVNSDRAGSTNALPKPAGQFGLTQLPGRSAFHQADGFGFFEIQSYALVCKKNPGCDPCGSFVAVGEAVVFDESECISRREVADIGLSICSELLWPGQGRLDHSLIANPIHAAMLGNLPVMQRVHY